MSSAAPSGDPRVRVLLITDSFPPRCGGSGHSVAALARGLREAGAEVGVLHRVVGRRPRIREDDVDGISVQRLEVPELAVPALRDLHRALVRDRALERAIAAHVATARPDVLHAQQGSNFAAVARAGRRAGIGRVATVRDYAPICLRTTRFTAGAICPGCSPLALASCFADRYGRAGWALAPAVPIGLWATRRRTHALDGFGRVIAVSRYVAEALRAAGVRAPIEVLANLPPRPVDARPRPPAAPDGPYVVFAGKLNREKGADLLAQIARALPSGGQLVVLGDGPLAGAIDAASSAGAPLVRLGEVPNDEALGWIAHARALVLPSRWPEPLSRLLLEAGALGTPVVAFATGGTPELVTHERDGLLAASDRELVEAVARVVREPELRARMAAAARERMRTDLARGGLLERVLDVYRHARA